MSSQVFPTVVVRRARPEDRDIVERMLAAARLPLDGVREHFDGFLVAVTAGGVVGAIGLERYGRYGLLRSAVVEEGSRGRGIGALLTARLVEGDSARGLDAMYLLTTTAPDYFPRFGFRPIRRDQVPHELDASAEFRGACPESAVVMVREFKPARV
jgi:amino-acid N-acetyltransferase